MKKLLVVAICLTFASCGLFNRTVTKRKLDASTSAKVETSNSYKRDVSVQSVDVSQGGRVTSTPGKTGTIKGKMNNGMGIVTDSAGLLLVALIDSLSGNLTIGYSIPGGYTADWWQNKAQSDSTDKSSGKRDSTDQRSEKVSANAVDKESKPNFIGTLAMWVGIGLVVIAAIWAVAKFVFKR